MEVNYISLCILENNEENAPRKINGSMILFYMLMMEQVPNPTRYVVPTILHVAYFAFGSGVFVNLYDMCYMRFLIVCLYVF